MFLPQVYLSGADNTHPRTHLNFYTGKHNDSLHIIHDPGLLNCNCFGESSPIRCAEEDGWCDKLHCESKKEWGMSKGRSGDVITSSSSCAVTQTGKEENGGGECEGAKGR